MDNDLDGNPVEIWSNSLAVIGPVNPTSVQLELVLDAVWAYWQALRPKMDSRVKLDWFKANEFNAAAPHQQITDPSHGTEGLNVRGTGGLSGQPLTTSMRVSIDDGTRNQRARGGWYLPVPSSPITEDWRYAPSEVNAVLAINRDFLQAVNALPGMTPGVWSRAGSSVTASTRVRIGNVPDNLGRRKNALSEVYQTVPIP
jgi:hypothetical protein